MNVRDLIAGPGGEEWTMDAEEVRELRRMYLEHRRLIAPLAERTGGRRGERAQSSDDERLQLENPYFSNTKVRGSWQPITR